MTVEFLDARRLTGPNLLSDGPGSILDIACDGTEVDRVRDAWSRAIEDACARAGWHPRKYSHALTGGISLAFSAPIDALYAASEINEWAWRCIEAELSGQPPPDFDMGAHADAMADEENAGLLALQQSAADRGVTFLWDDDNVSLGLGSGSQTWPARALPEPGSLDWTAFHDIPVAIVTGTNGKTTTARLASFIMAQDGHRVGMSCTDALSVDNQVIDRGDWSGPGGARTILRNTSVTAAVLETARGGLLRRGLGVERADAAVITGIAADHLGDYGSQTLEELLDIKWIVSRAVERSGTLVLNAQDERLVHKARDYPGRLVWFSLDPSSPVVVRHIGSGGAAFVLAGKDLLRRSGHDEERICGVDEVPLALAGAARHNVANALAAAAATHAMGASIATIAQGLRQMTQQDNPGRTNLFTVAGVNFLIDFAHNPQAMEAVFSLARTIPAKRRLLAFGQAGDRPDDLIRELTRAAWSIGLNRVLVSELEQYHRGRSHREVFGIIRDELVRLGAAGKDVIHFESELDAFDHARGWAEPGDLVIMLALGEREAIKDALASAGAG